MLTLSLRDYLYLAIIAIVGFCAWDLYHHGELKVEAKDKALVEAQKVHVAEVKSQVQIQLQKAIADYEAAHSTPIVDPPSLVCRVSAPRSSTVPHDGSSSSKGNGGTSVPDESTVPFNPAPAVLEDGRDADAQVKLLQDYIRTCQSVGICKK